MTAAAASIGRLLLSREQGVKAERSLCSGGGSGISLVYFFVHQKTTCSAAIHGTSEERRCDHP